MNDSTSLLPRPTYWVMRIIAATAVVQLLLETLFTAPGISFGLGFNPGHLGRQPWGFLTYLFVHDGLLHLAANMVGLYLFGTAVEGRMGSKPFLLYYLYCGVGAAAFSLFLSLFSFQAPMIGASGAVLGVAVAFAWYWPEVEILVFPIPVPIKARTLVIGLAVISAVWSLFSVGPVAHEAHLGGMAAGWLLLRIRGTGTVRRRPSGPRRRPELAVMAQQSAATAAADARPARSSGNRPSSDPVSAELDRLLDKISARGIHSLTAEERRFLDEVSKRKQRDLH